MKFFLVVAMDEERGIGIDGTLPWHLSKDLKHFAKITRSTTSPRRQNAVVMGRKTWESLPDSYRPLPGRLNIVLTSSKTYHVPSEVIRESSFGDALRAADAAGAENIFIIGGGRVFQETLNHPSCAGAYVTEVAGNFNCDTFFPEIDPERFERTEESSLQNEGDIKFRFVTYRAR